MNLYEIHILSSVLVTMSKQIEVFLFFNVMI